MEQHTLKACPKCGQEKPLTIEHWYPDGRYEDTFRSPCRECHRTYRQATKDRKAKVDRAWYDRNRDRKLAYQQRYQRENREALREYQQSYYRAHKERLNEQGKRYYQENKERLVEANSRWAAANREAVKAVRHNFHARRLGLVGTLSAEDIIGKWELQGGKCYYCGISLGDWQIDHKIPRSSGGPNLPANICIACEECNSRKHTTPFFEFLASLQQSTD